MKKINNFGEFLNEGFFDRFKKPKTKFGFELADENPEPEIKPDLNDAADKIHPIDYSLVTISDEELTPEKLEEILDSVLSTEDTDSTFSLIRKLKIDHPYIINHQPYQSIYWTAVKKWHESINKIR